MQKNAEVEIRPVCEHDRELIKNIYNLYQNDLSAYTNDFKYLDANGLFDARQYTQVLPFGDGVFTYIITENGKNVGLTMVTDRTYAPEGCDFCFQEMYIIRPARGRGIAQSAAALALEGRGGVWGLEVYNKNLPALGFWRKFVSTYDPAPVLLPGESDMTLIKFRVWTI